MNFKVQFTKTARKQFPKLPTPIFRKLTNWVSSVEELGLPEVQKIKGYHDEPLQGELQGKRSVRLNIQWRIIYEIAPSNDLVVVTVERITPHEYRH